MKAWEQVISRISKKWATLNVDAVSGSKQTVCLPFSTFITLSFSAKVWLKNVQHCSLDMQEKLPYNQLIKRFGLLKQNGQGPVLNNVTKWRCDHSTVTTIFWTLNMQILKNTLYIFFKTIGFEAMCNLWSVSLLTSKFISQPKGNTLCARVFNNACPSCDFCSNLQAVQWLKSTMVDIFLLEVNLNMQTKT